jgi:hypothetical protein
MPRQAFAPAPPTDLVLPDAGSTTARAIHSLGQRALFEWLKHGPFPDDAGPDFEALRRTLAGFLPGRPKVVSTLLEEPSVTTPLRRMRLSMGDADTGREATAAAHFVLEARGALDEAMTFSAPPPRLLCVDPLRYLELPPDTKSLAITPRGVRADGSELPPTTSGRVGPIEGRQLVAMVGEGDALEPALLALRSGLGALRDALPGLAGALDRVVRLVVVSDASPGSARVVPEALSVIHVPASDAVTEVAESLTRATARTLVHALHELDPLAPDEPAAIDALGDAAEAAVAAALHATFTRAHRAYADADRARALSEAFFDARAALSEYDGALTPVGRGVLTELVTQSAI